MDKLQHKASRYLTSILTFLVMICFLASCATMKTHKLYKGRQLPDNKIAHLISKKDKLLVHSVDGVESPDGKESYDPGKFELLPGDHTLTVSFRRNFAVTRGRSTVYYRSTSTKRLDVRFRSEAGHTYLLTAQQDPKREQWYAIVIDGTQNKRIVDVGPYTLNTVQTYVVTPPPKGR